MFGKKSMRAPYILFPIIILVSAVSQADTSFDSPYSLKVRLHEWNNEVCGAALSGFASTPAVSASYPDDFLEHKFVDFCKSLVILDNKVLDNLKQSDFSAVMGGLVGGSPSRGATVFENWAEKWLAPQGEFTGSPDCSSGDERMDKIACPRPAVTEFLKAAWPGGIRLIAIVNRLELLNPEFRLIYQVVEDGAARDLSIIMEFAMTPSGLSTTQYDAYLREQARKWQALGSPKLDAAGFQAHLQDLVDSNSARLLRIRTLEGVDRNYGWQFRQFDNTGLSPNLVLEQKRLTRTPGDIYWRNGSDKRRFYRYLNDNPVKNRVITGDLSLYGEYAWKSYEGYKSSFRSVGSNLWRLGNQQEVIVSFNTCNGCHKHFSEGDNGEQIKRYGSEAFAKLSSFLTEPVEMHGRELPECTLGDDSSPGCIEISGREYWYELKNRCFYLFDVATKVGVNATGRFIIKVLSEEDIETQVPAGDFRPLSRYH